MTMSKILPLALAAGFLAGCGAPDDGSASYAKGKEAFAARDLKAAVKHLSASVKVCATNFDAQATLALASLALGDVASAETAAAAARRLEPDSAEATLLAAEVAWHRKDYSGARALYTAVAGGKGLEARLRSQALASRAVVEIVENEFDAARLSLWRAMRLDRRNAAAWYHLGVLSRDTWKFDDAALDQFGIAARFLDPASPRARDVSRNVLPALRDAVARAAAAKPGLSARNPGRAAALIQEGEALLAKRQQARALKKFAEAFAADRLSHPAAWNYAKLLAATARTSADVDKTLEVYRAAIEAKPVSQATALAAARFALANRRWATAAGILNRSLAYDPEARVVVDLYIQALEKSGEAKTAALYQAWRREI